MCTRHEILAIRTAVIDKVFEGKDDGAEETCSEISSGTTSHG